MNKHAYLILAHNNWDTLEKLILLIDDYRNDIYLHVDKKVKSFDRSRLINLPRESNIYVYSQNKVYWGGFSLTECEMFLMKKAIKKEYSYLHILSGADLPIQSQDDIHNFFQINEHCEFIQYQSDDYVKNTPEISRRVSVYHFLQNYRNRFRFRVLNDCFIALDRFLILLQLALRVNRWKQNTELKYGSNWVSITKELAQYLVNQENQIKRLFQKTNCSDELFIQTIAFNSYFRDRIYRTKEEGDMTANLRLIDWERGSSKGNPYVWHVEDYDRIMQSDCMFARKFDTSIDSEIIDKIYERISESNRKNRSKVRYDKEVI